MKRRARKENTKGRSKGGRVTKGDKHEEGGITVKGGEENKVRGVDEE